MDWSTIGNFLGNNSNVLGNLIGTGSQLYGQQNAGEAISKASTAGIGEARAGMGDVSGYWNNQRTLGNNADTALSSSLGIGGQPANYSNFMNMPGYGFAVQQGTQAAERQAAAMGNAGNSGTAAMIGNQVTGTAMGDYNNYINQLYQAAGLGSTANSAMTGARMQTAGNVEQLGTNAGMAQAGMYTGMGQTASGVAGGGYGGGAGGAGAGGSSGVGGLIGSGLKAIGNWLGGNNNSGGGTYATPGGNMPTGDITAGYTNNTNDTSYYNANQDQFGNFQPTDPSGGFDYGLGGDSGSSATPSGPSTSGIQPLTADQLQPGTMADVNGMQPNVNIAGGGSSGNSFSSVGNGIGTAAGIFGIQQGLQRGGVTGYGQAALNAGKIANINGAFGGSKSFAGGALGAGAGVLGMYNGIRQGGVAGYGGAAVGGLQTAAGVESMMGNGAAAGALGSAAGYVAAPLAVYSAIKNWQSGSTGNDTIQGAEAGAAVGSIVPGVGTVIGAVIGGAVGALSSAFGGGKTSTEATNDRSIDQQLAGASVAQRAQAISTMNPAQAFQTVNGFMNAHDSSPGHSEPIQQVFGKNGVSNMFGQMMPAINQAIAKNPSLKNLPPSQLYAKVVAPWLASKGATINPNQRDVKGNPEGQNLIDAITGVVGNWQTGKINSKTSLGIAGQSMNIPTYGG